jgi:hypothetical protein
MIVGMPGAMAPRDTAAIKWQMYYQRTQGLLTILGRFAEFLSGQVEDSRITVLQQFNELGNARCRV